MKPKNIQIMRTRPDVSDEEIRTMMDFDKVLADHKKKVFTTRYIYGSIATAIIIATAVYLLWPKQKPVAPSEDQPVNQQTMTTDSATVGPLTEQKLPPKETIEKPRVEKKSTTPKETEIVKEDQYQEAEPVNGYPDLYEYFDRELKYPKEALKDSIEGTVSLSFVIDEAGKPKDINITHSLGPLFDEESIRIIQQMPAWKPAMLNGKAKPVKISVPLNFRIDRTKKP